MLSDLAMHMELDAWRLAKRTPTLWWRDDDAADAGGELRRLLDLSTRYEVPLGLAVVPLKATPQTVRMVNRAPLVTVLQHGSDHENAQPPAHPPGQFADTARAEGMAADLIAASRALDQFERRAPVYVPPWNRVQPELGRALPIAGLSGLSGFGGARLQAPLARLDVHVDILRWKGRPRFKGRGRVAGRLRRELRTRRLMGHWGEPIGVLTHHLDHDEGAWRFLESLFAWTTRSRTVNWTSVTQALAGASA